MLIVLVAMNRLRCTAAFPVEAFQKIVRFVGDARSMNPMTAVLARAIAEVSSQWNIFRSRLLVQQVLAELSMWWSTNGGAIVVAGLDKAPTGTTCWFKFPRELFQSCVAAGVLQLFLASDTQWFDKETHILHCIASYFSVPPWDFGVTCSIDMDEFRRRPPPGIKVRHVESFASLDLLTVPNSAALDHLFYGRVMWAFSFPRS